MDYIDNLRLGDIVFRSGDRMVAKIIGTNMTHCGIYIGNNIIHDLHSNGLRYVTTDEFLLEAIEPKEIHIFRLKGEFGEIVINKLKDNIMNRKYHLPYNKKPWNICSSADEYNTATCVEYCYKQFIYAIWCLLRDEENKFNLKKHYRLQDDDSIDNIQLLEVVEVRIPDYVMEISEAFFSKGNYNKGIFDNKWEGDVHRTNVLRTITIDSFSASKFFSLIKK